LRIWCGGSSTTRTITGRNPIVILSRESVAEYFQIPARGPGKRRLGSRLQLSQLGRIRPTIAPRSLEVSLLPCILTDLEKHDLNIRGLLSSPRRAMIGAWRHAKKVVLPRLASLLLGAGLN